MPVRPSSFHQYIKDGCGRCELGGTPQCKVRAWGEELGQLRDYLQDSGLEVGIKWGAPCYTHNGKNILMLSALKDSVVVSFFRGAELADKEGILEKPGENSRFARYLRFTGLESILGRKEIVLAYIREAVALEESGTQAKGRGDEPEEEYPPELLQAFQADPEFEKAFAALTPGRKRGYLIHISSAKQPKTRFARIEKFRDKIIQGKGWNNR
jgi:uncharacterized protein YdeI (YjbR/CyaY-like superfamily)